MPGSLFDFSAHPIATRPSVGSILEEGLEHASRGLIPSVPPAIVVRRPDMGLHAFARDAWHVVEPSEGFVDGWHLGAIAEHLEAVTSGEIRNLIINMPPRHMKSLMVSVFWMCWEWTFQPHVRWLFSSYGADLAIRDSLKCRRIFTSPWFQSHWRDRFRLTGDQNAKARFENDKTGYRIATSVDGMGTGEGGDRIVVDDPHNVKKAASDVEREGAITWWKQTMSTRGNNPKTVGRVIVMQRLHERDLSGEMIAEGGYEQLILPAEYEASRSTVSVIGWKDPRKKEGELLQPQRFDRRAIESLKKDLGSYGAAGQLQQRPAPASGGMVKREWWRYYDALPVVWEQQLLSLDAAFKGETDSDYIALGVWGRLGADVYLLDQVVAQLEYIETTRALGFVAWKHPKASLKLVEDKANGPAIISSMRRTIPGLVAVEPDGDKVARVRATAPFIESGNVWLPGPAHARRIHLEWVQALAAPVLGLKEKDLQPSKWLTVDALHSDWVDRFVGEWTVFPKGANDDQVDQGTQAIRRLMAGIGRQLGTTATMSDGSEAVDEIPNTSDVVSRRF